MFFQHMGAIKNRPVTDGLALPNGKISTQHSHERVDALLGKGKRRLSRPTFLPRKKFIVT